MKAEANWGPRLEMRVSCKLNHSKMKSRNSWAIPAALIVLEQRERITPFVRPWSTMTITKAKPEERERSVIRSTESCLNGRETEDEIGQVGGNGRMHVDLILLANCTVSNEIFDKGRETWPPEVTFEDRLGVENSHVTQEGGRMDGMEESRAGQRRNIHAIVKIEVSIVKYPI